MAPRLLFVSNDPARAGYLTAILGGGEFQITHTSLASSVVAAIAVAKPDVILMELGALNGNTPSVCRYLRETYDTPIVVCSASGRESDIVEALEAGADDYLAMPVRPVELLARLRAAMRRGATVETGQPRRDRLLAGDLEIRLDEHRVYHKGAPIDLSPIEFRLLTCLAGEAGRVVTHAKLIAKVWGPEYVNCRHYLRLYIRYLRAKLEDDPRDPKLVLSEWGVGYRFQAALT
jgi:two-component system KDP operon response regulator KdpE